MLPANIETASTKKKKLKLNVYQISSQFIQQIVPLIGKKYSLIRISLCFKYSIACRTKRVR